MTLLDKIPVTWRTPLLVGGVLIVGLVIWFYGARLSNSIGDWWFQRGVNQSQKEIQQYKDLAAETLKQLAAQKEITAAERAKREQAEKILADKRLNTDEKLKAYEKAVSTVATPGPPESTDELCARAATLGIACQ